MNIYASEALPTATPLMSDILVNPPSPFCYYLFSEPGIVELVDAADRLAAHLAGHGIRPGNRVAVWLPSRVATAIALLACSRNGYMCCPSLHRLLFRW
jgi:acyl-CoA synthetase (AMP-forming)/AMP-acid ligase II